MIPLWSRQYTAQLSVQVLFGTESSAGAELIQEFDAMYASINEEVQELGGSLAMHIVLL